MDAWSRQTVPECTAHVYLYECSAISPRPGGGNVLAPALRRSRTYQDTANSANTSSTLWVSPSPCAVARYEDPRASRLHRSVPRPDVTHRAPVGVAGRGSGCVCGSVSVVLVTFVHGWARALRLSTHQRPACGRKPFDTRGYSFRNQRAVARLHPRAHVPRCGG